MKSQLLTVLVGVSLVSANIIFPFVQPTCDHRLPGRNSGCLRGQVCLWNDTCVPAYTGSDKLEKKDIRDDGRCGSDFGGATCDPNGEYGGCCSAYGYCGKTTEHCSVSSGCQSGCTGQDNGSSDGGTGGADPSPTPAQPSPTDPAASNSEPVIKPSNTASDAAPTGSVTTDGTCGASNGNTVCGDWPQGACCSMYGFCGSSAAHCGDGCQSGPCKQAPVEPAPSASPAPQNANPGSFATVGQSGVPAMHAALMPNGKVVFLNKVENYTQLKLSSGYYAYSAEYDPATNEVVPLSYKTNAFCSGGSFLGNGTLINVGGNGPPGSILLLVMDSRDCATSLDQPLMHHSTEILGSSLGVSWTLLVASGSLNGLNPTKLSNNNPTYEILSPEGITNGQSTSMELLIKAQPYYMYPFLHLLQDGSLFAFVSKSSVLFDIGTNTNVKTYPDLPGEYRTYPNTGGAVMLPLSLDNDWTADIVVCGGGSYQDITSPTDPSCGRISPLADNPQWEMDSMPEGRGMVEGTLLPDGTVLWVNGAQKGSEGFNLAADPAFEVFIYDPEAPLGQRWTTGASSTIPRLYHSVAVLLLDGTLMIAGSNPDQMPVVAPEKDPQGFNTEFAVEIYTPPYLSGENANRRPTDIKISTTDISAGSSTFTITFTAPAHAQELKVALYHGGFVTHAVHMSHRMLFLSNNGWHIGATEQKITVAPPPNSNVAPPGPYVVHVVVDGVPGIGQFVLVS